MNKPNILKNLKQIKKFSENQIKEFIKLQNQKIKTEKGGAPAAAQPLSKPNLDSLEDLQGISPQP